MYRCIKCGYQGESFIFQFTDYTYCVATNPSADDEPEYIEPAPEWVTAGDATIGNPVGCPQCKCWGIGNFEEIEEEVKP